MDAKTGGWPVAVLGLMLSFIAACGSPARQASPTSGSPPSPQASPGASASRSGASASASGSAARPDAPGAREAVNGYVRKLPGTLGMIVRDRVTGTVWQAGDPAHATWTASTIKLALATALIERQRAGVVRLTAADRTGLRSMLVDSSNEATDALWEKYDGVGLLPVFRTRYGMATLRVVPGYRPHWRHLECGTADLAALMSYALDALAGGDRAELVALLRAAGRAQPWGVWAAGPAAAPGHKPGWAYKPEGRPDHWVVHSVGFAGPAERYVVAVMYDLPRAAGVREGAQAVSDVVALAFGHPVPVPVTGP